MDSPPTGSKEIVYISTEKADITIKGKGASPSLLNSYAKDSSLTLYCRDPFEIEVQGVSDRENIEESGILNSYRFQVPPLFFEQQSYELIIEPKQEADVSFWHENEKIRNRVSQTGRKSGILSGILNFGNEIGQTDLLIYSDKEVYLKLILEVFPTKIDYKNDFQAILRDVTNEVYNLVFDFLKKTYVGYQQKDQRSVSPVEFFAVISQIYDDLVRSLDILLTHPHHTLEVNNEVLLGHKIKRSNTRTIRWINTHPSFAKKHDERVEISRALAVRKQVTYDTNENRLTKQIISATIKKLEEFKSVYSGLQQKSDVQVIEKLDRMIYGLKRRLGNPVLQEVCFSPRDYGISLVFSFGLGYRDLYKYYLLLSRGLSISGDIFRISIKDLSLLYEYWCFIKLNSLLKNKYELVSQDVIKVNREGLSVQIIKGRNSNIRYRNPDNGELITLSYNPTKRDVPTVAQIPDNVLCVEKKSEKINYEYIFDAKYRINTAEPDSYYFNSISHRPGPEVDDINTMHRYRDSIVYRNQASPYERQMFGAYVLFPYSDEEDYRNHRFYESIGKVNIGGLPFLPTATNLVAELIDDLVSESAESAFERATLPKGMQSKLNKVNWDEKDVLIGTLRNTEQLEICKQNNFYYIPSKQIIETDFPIRYVALYQSKNLFKENAGIHFYGEVSKIIPIKRHQINESPSLSEEAYYKFEVKKWLRLDHPIKVKNIGYFAKQYTNLFLLRHCTELPELLISSQEEYRLHRELKRVTDQTTIKEIGNDWGFVFKDASIMIEDRNIHVYRNRRIICEFPLEDFKRYPHSIVKSIDQAIIKNNLLS